jgi:hypothetical protein
MSCLLSSPLFGHDFLLCSFQPPDSSRLRFRGNGSNMPTKYPELLKSLTAIRQKYAPSFCLKETIDIVNLA